MAIYRVDLDRSAALQLFGGTALLGVLLFFSGAVVGYSVSTGSPAVPRPLDPEAAPMASAAGPEADGAAAREADPAGPQAAADTRPAETWAASPPPALPSAHAAAGWAVEVGAFRVRGNADALAARLRDRGYEPLIVTARHRSGDWLEHVRLSVHPEERAALLAAGSFTLREQLPAVVVAVAEDGPAPW